jgi:transcriptional regulator with XRE-family HTH domain
MDASAGEAEKVGHPTVWALQTFRSGGDHPGRMKLPLDKAESKAVSRAAGAGIARMRARAGLTQEGVAESLGIGIEAVSRLERGVIEPGVIRLVELAELFGCGVAELLVPASSRVFDQASAIAQEISGLPAKDRDALVAIVRHLAELLRSKQGKRQTDKG